MQLNNSLSKLRQWTNDLHVVFDFYKDNPQRVTSPNDHVVCGQTGNAPDQRPYWKDIGHVKENDQFLEGMLLKSLEKDCMFPYIHYLVYHNQPTGPLLGPAPRPLGPIQTSLASNGNSGGYTTNKEQLADIVASQGGYREVYTFVDHQTALLPKRPQNPHAAYVISAFKANGSRAELDKSWSYWSGADLIVETIPSQLKLQRLTFHKVKYDLTSASFVYVLMCELGEALTYPNRALEFVGTLKDRQCGVSSLYKIDHIF